MSQNWCEEIVEYWGTNNLRVVSKSTLKAWGFNTETAEYLCEVGIVRSSAQLKGGLGIAFDLVRSRKLQTLDQVVGTASPLPNGAKWIALGHCYESFIGLHIEEGYICLFESGTAMEEPEWFLNSSLKQMMYSLTKALRFFDWARETKADSHSIENLRVDLTEIDPQALECSYHWWPQMLHEIEHGIL